MYYEIICSYFSALVWSHQVVPCQESLTNEGYPSLKFGGSTSRGLWCGQLTKSQMRAQLSLSCSGTSTQACLMEYVTGTGFQSAHVTRRLNFANNGMIVPIRPIKA